MRKVWIIVLLGVVLATCPLQASQFSNFHFEWSGDLTEKVTYNYTLKQWQNLIDIDLGLSCDYNYNINLYLNPKLTYQTIFTEDSNLDLQLREGYIDLYFDQLDLRLGKQLINWGSAYKFNPTNRLNPMDLAATDPTSAYLGVPALKGEYYLNNTLSLTGVIVGEFVPATIPEELQKSQAQELQNTIFQQLLALGYDPLTAGMLMENLSSQTTDPTITGIDDLEYALKLTKRNLYGYDLSLSFFRGYEDFPTLESNLPEVIQSLAIGQNASIDFGYQRTNSIGVDIIGEVMGVGVWSETALNINDAKQKTLETILGGDYTFQNNLYTVFQYYHRNPLKNAEEKAENYLMLHAQIPVRQIHQLSTTLIYDLGEQAILLNPELKISLYNNLSLNLGTLYTSDFAENSTSLLSNFGTKQTYLGISYGF